MSAWLLLVVALAGCAGSVPASPRPTLAAQPGQVIFGRDLAGDGAAVADPVTCLDPDYNVELVGRFARPLDGVVTVEFSENGGPPVVKRTHTLIGGIDWITNGFHAHELDGPADFAVTMVHDGETVAQGVLRMDSWPPSGCPLPGG
jgi:hypothetical protein